MQLDLYPVEIVGVDKEITRDAALLKGKYRVAYADCLLRPLPGRSGRL